jgi:hypothetical protein
MSWLILILGVLVASPAWAACLGSSPTYTAATANLADVKACTDKAINGDTVNIPPGDVEWTANLNIAGKAIALIGAGRGPDPPAAPNPVTDTIIRDNVPRAAGGHMLDIGGGAIDWSENGAHIYESCARLAHIRFTNTPALTTNNNQGMIVGSNCIQFDNLTIDHIYGPMIRTYGALGVISDGYFTTTNRHGVLIFVNNQAYKGVGSHGDNSWAVNTEAGTGNFLYIERMTLLHTDEADGVVDEEAGGAGGGRVVVRNSQLLNGAGLVTHPTGHGPTERGGRHIESYRNTYFYSTSSKASNANFITSGTLLMVDNRFTGFTNAAFFDNWRAVDDTNTYRTAAGRGPWDTNGTALETGSTITTGGASIGTGGTFTVSDSSKSWGTNVHAGNRFWNVTRNWGTKIVSNTPTQLTLGNCARYGCGQYTASVGDTYEINPPPYPTLDQIGWASVTGTTTVLNGGTGPPGWIKEVLQPVYFIANTYANVTNKITTSDATVFHNNVEYYTEAGSVEQSSATVPFNGTSGTGWGTLARRPPSCTSGVAYWATDQGTWDTEKTDLGQASGKMYVCVASAWVARWGDNPTGEPYRYPHPLTSGSMPPPPVTPAPPTGFQIVP